MARIRIDDDAYELVDSVAEQIDGSKKGLASEFIRRGAESMIESSEYLCDTCNDDGVVIIQNQRMDCPDCDGELDD